MVNQDNFMQNLKISQIDIDTIIIGVDIAKEFNVARAFDYRGVELSKKELEFSNYESGYNSFDIWIENIAKIYNKNKVFIGAEPTGHYWFPLYEYILNKPKGDSISFHFVLVNPHHVKKSKELDDNSQRKTDKKDAKVIGLLVRDGRYSFIREQGEDYINLRNYSRIRTKYNKELNKYANNIIRWSDRYFPELRLVYADLLCKTSLVILKEFSFPEVITEHTHEEISKKCKEYNIRGGIPRSKYAELFNEASTSVGIKSGITSAKFEIVDLVDTYNKILGRIELINAEIEYTVNKIPYYTNLMEVDGLGTNTVSSIISEIGDISNFSSPKQLIKLAGLSLKENSSGKHKGKTTISKRGRARLRSALYRAVMCLVVKNSEFAILHNYYKTRSDNPLTGKQSMIALCGKLLKIIFGMAKTNTKYDPDIVLGGIKPKLLALNTAA